MRTEKRVPSSAPGAPAERLPRQNFETWSWFFMRVSGLVLVFLALVHFAITHIVHDVKDTQFDFVEARWQNPLWRVFDWSLLGFALLHGVNGLRLIVDDYVQAPVRRAATKATLYTLTAALFAYGSLTIFLFGGR